MPASTPPSAQIRHRRYLLISPPGPCGIAYLGDVLLRLGIRVTHHDIEAWDHLADHTYWLNEPGRQQLSPRFACLSEQPSFEFPEPVELRYEHRLDLINHPCDGVILLSRDPLDTLFSQFRRLRLKEGGIDFPRYLSMPTQNVQHLNHRGLVMKPLELQGLFYLFWRLAAAKLFHVRFEDAKANPVETVSALLAFIGVTRPAEAIRKAVDDSSLEKGQADTRLPAEWRQENVRGVAFEWQERMSAEEWQEAMTGEPIRTAVQVLGYGGPAVPLDEIVTQPPHSLITMIRHTLGDMERRTITAERFCQLAAGTLDLIAPKAAARPASVEIWWLDSALDEIMALNSALRLLERVLEPQHSAALGWHLRLWTGLASILLRAQGNPGMRWMQADLLLPKPPPERQDGDAPPP